MAKISTYSVLSIPTLNDKLIGTDVNTNNETKNFLVSDILNLTSSSLNLYKGSFYDNITQTLTGGANVAVPIRLNSTDTSATNGVSVVTDGTNLTRITVANSGVYNILFSAQVSNSAGSTQVVDFWLRKNGATAAFNVADTTGKVQLQSNNTFVMAAWNYFIALNAGDYIYLMWTATSTNISLIATPANAVHPASPSVILTLNQV
jgi:hypothetical protein